MGTVLVGASVSIVSILPFFFLGYKKDMGWLFLFIAAVGGFLGAFAGAAAGYLGEIWLGYVFSALLCLVLAVVECIVFCQVMKNGWRGVVCGLVSPIVTWLVTFGVSCFWGTDRWQTFTISLVLMIIDIILLAIVFWQLFRKGRFDSARLSDFD